MNIIEKPREIIDQIFVADDGQEFATEYECVAYEGRLKRNEEMVALKEKLCKIEKIYSEKKSDIIPIGLDLVIDSYKHDWYVLKDDEEKAVIEKLYGTEINCASYPIIIAVETLADDEDYYFGDEAYIYKLEDSISYAKKFFDIMGYDVEIKKR